MELFGAGCVDMKEIKRRRFEMDKNGITIDNGKVKSDCFETKRVLITPQIATATINKNKLPNRKLNKERVKYLANIMRRGQFMCTHQGIALDLDGNVIDGNHRLHAIVESNCSVYMMVSKGVPVDTMQVVDSMGHRSLLQRLQFVGINTNSKILSIAKALEYGIYANIGEGLQDIEAKRILDKYSGALDFVHSLDPSGKVVTPVMSVIARAYYTQDRDRLKRFVKVYRTGVPENPSETAPLRLKSKVENLKKNANANRYQYRLYTEEMYWYAESALSRFLNDENVAVLQINRG